MVCTAATCPCGNDDSMRTASAAATNDAPARTASIAVIASSGSADRFASCSMFDLAALAVAAPQIHRLVVATLPGLIHMTTLDPGHMHRTRSSYHTLHASRIRRIPYATH